MTREWNHRRQRCGARLAIVLAATLAMCLAANGYADEGKVIVVPDEPSAPGGAAPRDSQQAPQSRDAYMIKASLEQGTSQMTAGNYAEAKAEMEWVLSVDPENAAAKAKLAEIDALIARQAENAPKAAPEDAVKQHRLQMEFRYYQANALIAEGKYDEAISKLEMAIAIGKTIPGAEKLLKDAEAGLAKVQQCRNAQMCEEAVAQRADAARLVKLYEEKQKEKEAEQADELFATAKKLYQIREFKRALDTVNKLIKIDEKYPGATRLKEMIETDGRKAIAAAVEEEKKRSHEAELNKIDEWTPQNELLVLPDTPRTHEPADEPFVEDAQAGPSVRSIYAALQRKVSCDFDRSSMKDVVGYLRNATGCNIVVDPRCTKADEPIISMSVTDREMTHVLNSACRLDKMRWTVKDEMIIVSDREIDEDKQTRSYDIGDLCVDPKSFTYADSPSRIVGESVIQDKDGPAKAERKAAEEREKIGQSWAQFFRTTVARGTWSDEPDGKAANTIQFRGGKLVVSHNADVHKKIMKLLDAFRKARAVQVSIQARFIDINKDYLERAGIDWTGLDNLATRGLSRFLADGIVPLPAGASYQGTGRLDEYGIPVTAEPLPAGSMETWPPWYYHNPDLLPPYAWRGNPGEPGVPIEDTRGRRPWPELSSQTRTPYAYPTYDFANAGRPSGSALDLRGANRNYNTVSFPPETDTWNAYGGLSLDVAFLSRYQVRAIVEAVKKQRNGSVLTQPRVTCFNGQRANIVVATLHNFIQSYDDEGIPAISAVTDGVVLEVKPYVSADQHYVTLELLPSITELRSFETILISRAVIVGLTGASGTIPLELPEVHMRSVETTVSVPDGGTVLIGGLSSVNEQEGYAGVPLLSKIPIIKYLFMSWGKLDQRESLVVLVTADILIQTELEPKLAQTD